MTVFCELTSSLDDAAAAADHYDGDNGNNDRFYGDHHISNLNIIMMTVV